MIRVSNNSGQKIVVSVSRWEDWGIAGTYVISPLEQEEWERSDSRGYIIRIAWAEDDITYSLPFFSWRNSEVIVYDGSVKRRERDSDGQSVSPARKILPIDRFI